MDDYPASDPIPDPNLVEGQFNELIHFLTHSQEMRQTAKSSLKQSLFAGGGALVGGFLLGPVGGLVGGIAGSLIGFAQAGEYDGAVLAICKLEGSERHVLMEAVGQVLMSAGATANQFQSSALFREKLIELAAQPTVRDQLWNACVQSARQG